MNFLEVLDEGDHWLWRIKRPERGNALGLIVAAELNQALAAVAAPAARRSALVLTAAPVVKGARRTWVAGGDLKELAALSSPDEAAAYAASLATFIRGLDTLPFPVIVAVDGAAIGGGAELALAGDLRVATAASTLAFKQLQIGLATGYGSARRLVDLVGLARAQGLLFGCRTLSAAEAVGLGLMHLVVPDAAALAAQVKTWCRELAALAPEALAAQKRMLWHAVHGHPGASYAAELALFRTLWRNPAHARALAAFAARSRDDAP